MLSASQAIAKAEAHRRLDYPTRIVAEERGRPGRDKLPRFRNGVEGIGVAGEILRIYVREDMAAGLEIPAKIGNLRVQRVLTTGFHDLAVP